MTGVVFPDSSSIGWQISEISNLRFADGTLVSDAGLKHLPTWLSEKLVETINQDFFQKKEVQLAASEVQGKGISVLIDKGALRFNIGTKKFAFDGESAEKFSSVLRSVKNYIRRVGFDPFGGAHFEKTTHKAKRLSKLSTDPEEMGRAVFQVDEAAQRLFEEPPKQESQAMANFVTGSGLVLNVSSIARDVLDLFDTPKVNLAGQLLRYVVNTPLLLLASTYMTYSSVEEYQHKKELGDKEGIQDAKAHLVEGGTLLGGTLLFTRGGIINELGPLAVGAGLEAVSGFFFGAAGIIGLTMGVRNIMRCNRFSDRIDAFMQNETLTEEQKVVGTLNLLRDQVMLSDNETKKLIEEVSSQTSLTQEERQALLEKKARNLMTTKISRLSRRAGSKSLKRILHEVDDILIRLDDPNQKVEALEQAKSLISDVKKENRKRKILYGIMLFASILSIAAFIITTVFSAFTLPFILGLVAASITLLLNLYSLGSHLLSKILSEEGAFSPAIEGLAALDSAGLGDMELM